MFLICSHIGRQSVNANAAVPAPRRRVELEASRLYCKKHYDRLIFLQDIGGIMQRHGGRKEHPLSMRLPEADIAVIDRAAVLRGRSRTEFVRDAAVRAAEDVLLENALIRMSPDGFEAFVEALSGPAQPAPEMVALFQRKAFWEQG